MNSEDKSINEKLKQTESKFIFDNLKSNIILKKIFNFMRKNKSMNIMRNSKKLQKRLNLYFNDYKEQYNFSLYNSPIEIELKFVDNKYDKFINIPDKNKEYFHIYFDYSKEEIKRNYLIQKD